MIYYMISLGSNINPEKNILKSHYYINKHIGTIINMSSLYGSTPMGFQSDNMFINQSITISSRLNPDQVLKKIALIDKIFSRVRIEEGYTDRPIDIDIILCNKSFNNQEAKLPHPRWKERSFVVTPNLEIQTSIFKKELSQIETKVSPTIVKFL